MIIDAHIHLEISPESIKKDVPQRIRDLKLFMKQAGISKALIFALAPCFKNILSHTQILSLIEKEEGLYLVGTFSITQGKNKDLQELEHLLKQKKIVGIKLYKGYEAFLPLDKRCLPVYELCEKYDVPVIFHTGDTFGGKVPIVYAHPLNIDELALRRPNLKIILAHCGNPWIEEAMLVINRHKNVYGDISGWTWGGFKSRDAKYLRTTFERLLGWCGAEKLLFGTDWPCNHPSMYSKIIKEYVAFVKSFKLPKEEEELILHKNAERLFKI